jgi:hypothetical protein
MKFRPLLEFRKRNKKHSPLRARRLETIVVIKRIRNIIFINLWKYNCNLLESIKRDIQPVLSAKREADAVAERLTQKGYSVSIAKLIISKEFESLSKED